MPKTWLQITAWISLCTATVWASFVLDFTIAFPLGLPADLRLSHPSFRPRGRRPLVRSGALH
jgi:hypothetical protein